MNEKEIQEKFAELIKITKWEAYQVRLMLKWYDFRAMIKNVFCVSPVMRRANRAMNKILDAQVLLAEIQGQQSDENEILFWCDRVTDCMILAGKINEHGVQRDGLHDVGDSQCR